MTSPRFWMPDEPAPRLCALGYCGQGDLNKPHTHTTNVTPSEEIVFELADEEATEVSQSPEPFTCEPIDAPRWTGWLVVLALLAAVLVLALGGCCYHGQEGVLVVGEARALLKDPKPGGPRWESRRATFLVDAEKFEADACECCAERPVLFHGGEARVTKPERGK